MNREAHSSRCPICGKLCINVNNMGLFRATCKSTGRVKGEDEERVSKFEHVETDGILTFENKDQTRVDWLYLEFDVKLL